MSNPRGGGQTKSLLIEASCPDVEVWAELYKSLIPGPVPPANISKLFPQTEHLNLPMDFESGDGVGLGMNITMGMGLNTGMGMNMDLSMNMCMGM